MSELTTRLVTYKDLIDHAVDYLGSNVTGDAARDARRSVQSAYRDLASRHNWSYYYSLGRLNTVAPQSTGTVAYDHTGGIHERQLTLTGATWPTWAAFGVVLIDNVMYQVADRKSSTVITLSVNSNPGEDVASGTAYTIWRDTYSMPVDFSKADLLFMDKQKGPLQYIHPSEWLQNQSYQPSPAQPYLYTFTSDPDFHGAISVRFGPPPDAIYPVSYIYRRVPRQLVIDEYKAGSATCTNGSTTVSGNGTTWSSNHVGAVIRFSANKTTEPTGLAGTNPFQIQRVITEVANATSLTIDQAVIETLTGVKYTISDPVDIETGTMLTPLHRMIEKQMRLARRMKPLGDEEMAYRDAIIAAMEADARSFARREVGNYVWPRRLSDMPTGADAGV